MARVSTQDLKTFLARGKDHDDDSNTSKPRNKRKASTDIETPKKKMRVVNDTDTKNSCSVVSKDGSVRGTKLCLHFLQTCLNVDPGTRATLEQLKLHPWLQ
ncbi:hypothetical protein PAMP_000936 [Pampus punctatissimus]